MNGTALWESVCAEAGQRGIDPARLRQLVLAPLSRGGAGWDYWYEEKTTEALAAWLVRQLDQITPNEKRDKERGSVMTTFQKATKKQARLRLALVGPPGSGKTYTALTVARALGGKVAVIDTERGSASKYADLFDFDVLELAGDFHPKKYVEAIRAAEQAGYTHLIVDSLSHAWIGPGGGLDLHDQEVDRQKIKNAFTAWKAVTPHHNALVHALLQSGCHIIATMRSKVEYAQEGGKVKKLGMAPLMRDGIEYEFDVVGDLDLDHTLVISKSRCPALSGQVIKEPGPLLADVLAKWLSDGEPAPPPVSPTNGTGKGLGLRMTTHPLPKTPEELGEKLGRFDLALEKAGLCRAGDLIDAVEAIAKAENFGNDSRTIHADRIGRAVEIANQFADECAARRTPLAVGGAA